jgi:N-acyl-D-amino-acid deacylase
MPPDSRRRETRAVSATIAALLLGPPSAPAGADPPPLIVIRGGTVYDGTGAPGRVADVALRGDRIEAVGEFRSAKADQVIDARGLAVAPGFINMLSWSTESLLVDGRSQGEVRQGVTTQVFGEGSSMGPLNDRMKAQMKEDQADLKYEIAWTTLAEYLSHLERKGVAQNVASFIGAATVREHVIGLDDRPATPAELDAMRALVAKEMEAGALGIGSSLIYAPGSYASTEELIELCKVAARYRGRYISHLRSEGDRFLPALDELIRISREAGLPAEVYHLKAAGEANWPKLDQAIARIEAARREGLAITADMYTYTAGATGFDACVPRWSMEGGQPGLRKRLQDPATRARILEEASAPGLGFENLCLATGSPERILLVGFKTEALKPLTGRTLAEVARMRGKEPFDVMLDLMLEDQTRIEVVFFLMSEDNVRKQVRLPWVSFGSDAASMATEDPFTRSSAHPRAYGNFARLLGKYVRDEKLIDLAEAIRRLTSFPADNLGLADRGRLAPGKIADVIVFDPATVADRATFEKPHQYAVGMKHVFVNGVAVLRDGEHTGALPGRALRGPGAARVGSTRVPAHGVRGPAAGTVS